MRKLTRFGLWAGSLLVILWARTLVALADGPSLQLVNPLGTSNLVGTNSVLSRISGFLLIVAAPICGIMVLVGGFQMMTAAGDPKKFTEGRKTLVYAAVGFVIVLFASSVVPLLKSILGG